MRLTLTLIIFLFSIHSSAQNYYTDTLPRFNYQNCISFELKTGTLGAGFLYTRHFLTGLGYHNFKSISLGSHIAQYSFYDQDYKTTTLRAIDFDIRLEQNWRPVLSRLIYFTFHVGYSPLIPLEEHPSKVFDDYVNGGYMGLALQLWVKRINIGFYGGASVYEARQDLFFSEHVYARFYPLLRLKLGYSFGERED